MKSKIFVILAFVISCVLLDAAGPGPDLWKDLPQSEIDYMKFRAALNRGDVAVLKEMYNPFYNLDLTDSHGSSALAFVIFKNKPNYNEVASFLIEKGANINRANNKGVTPLMWAIEAGNIEGIDLLLKVGADIFAKDKKGKSILAYAHESKNPQIIKFFDEMLGEEDARESEKYEDSDEEPN